MELHRIYETIRPIIENRLEEFRDNYEKGDATILWELVFCLLTPQSRAKTCWRATERLKEMEVERGAKAEDIVIALQGVRFKYKKAQYVEQALQKFSPIGGHSLQGFLQRHRNSKEKRKALVKEIKGMGMKEASHFLRNIGMGEDLAILDRHILKNLVSHGVINEIPPSLNPRRYQEIEDKMMEFSSRIKIPLSHLDLVFWYKETGEVFK